MKSRTLYQRPYDAIYSRFTLHAITHDQQTELLRNLRDALSQGGRLFIEARSIRDALYGKGERVAEHAFVYNSHFRRFLEPVALRREMESLGYRILHLEEGKGFSKTRDSDPVLLRLVAEFVS